MEQLVKYTSFVETELSAIKLPNSPSDLYDPIRYILDLGGKRIRPVLTILGAELYNLNQEDVKNQALAIEIFHNFTLIHDDIMDEAPLRRKKPTVHEKWNESVGILSGDALLIIAYQHLCKAPSDKLKELFELFNATAIEVCEGQQLDMDFESRMDVTTADYIEMIQLKTSVLLGCALKMGAIMANASENDQNNLYDFGVNMGIAFQIQDDILDLYADPDKFGKQVGGDVIANKKTILYLTAISNSNSAQMEVLKQLQSEDNIELKLSRTREIFDHLKVRMACEELMEHHFNLAMNSLDKVLVTDTRKSALKSLATFLINRVN